MIITSLVENERLQSRPELRAEHGVSIHVQHLGPRIPHFDQHTFEVQHNVHDIFCDIGKIRKLVQGTFDLHGGDGCS